MPYREPAQEGAFEAKTSIIEGDLLPYLMKIQAINARAFSGDIFDIQELQRGLADRRSALAILSDTNSDEVVGYALAVPTNKPTIAHYVSNAILPEYQGKGFVAELSAAVEERLRTEGFLFVTRDTRTKDGYADKVRAAYGSRVQSEHRTKTAVGDSVSFTIEL